jgi:predicted phage-related endonuclease
MVIETTQNGAAKMPRAATATAARPWEAPKAAAPQPKAPAAEPVKSNTAPIVDEYGTVDAEIKRLEKRKKELGDQLRELGVGEYPGSKCKAVISTFSTNRLDTDGLKSALPEEMITKFTKTSETTKITIKALL